MRTTGTARRTRTIQMLQATALTLSQLAGSDVKLGNSQVKYSFSCEIRIGGEST